MSKGKLYRSPNGKIMGVCAGIANWLRMDVGLVRLGFIIASFASGGVVFFIYLALGIFLPIGDNYESESIYNKFKGDFSDNRRGSGFRGKVTVEDVKKEYDNLKSRVGNMEDKIFNKERDWDERFKKS